MKVLSEAPPNAPWAMAVPRPAQSDDSELAEVIDLVLLPSGARPTPVASVEWEEVPRLRVLGCDSYQRCLSFVARVRWKSFHCRQCPRNPGTSTSRPGQASEAGRAGAGVVVDLLD